jgi:hypothetical protein
VDRRAPLPRGPITYAEKQQADILKEARETNSLLRHIADLLERGAAHAGAPDAAAEVIREGAAPAEPEAAEPIPHGAKVHLHQFDTGAPISHEHVIALVGEPPGPKAEVKANDRPGAAAEKRQRHR